MASGVDLKSISTGPAKNGKVPLIVSLEVNADNEFEAVAWLVSMLDEDG